MATVRAILWKHKTNRDGLHPIYLRIEAGGRTRYRSLKKYVSKSQWNDGSGSVRKGHPNATKINALIKRQVGDATDELLNLELEGEEITAGKLKKRLAKRENGEQEEEPDFHAYADQIADQFERQGKIYSARRYRSICGKVEALTGRPFPFTGVTPAFLREYETHLIEVYENAVNTVASNMRCIRAVLYRAIKDGLLDQGANPFFQYQIKTERPDRERLSIDQVLAMEAIDLEEGSLIWHVRNYWLFSFYCGGVRFADVATMRCENVADGRLEYTMRKTGQKKAMKLVPQAAKIVQHYRSDGYLFPMLRGYDVSTRKKLINAIAAQNALVNKYLKKIAKRAEINADLSFHVSRHSFADIVRRSGWDVYKISKALGHSDLAVTEHYLAQFDAEGLDDSMDGFAEAMRGES